MHQSQCDRDPAPRFRTSGLTQSPAACHPPPSQYLWFDTADTSRWREALWDG